MKSLKYLLLLILLPGLLLSGCNQREQEESVDPGYAIQWVDPVLESVIRQEIGKPDGVIMQGDLAKIRLVAVRSTLVQINNGNVYRNEEGQGVTSLEDLTHFPKLGSLNLSYTQFESIAPVSRMTELQQLFIYENPNLTDITPIAGLPKLVDLAIYSNGELTDLSPIRTLSTLINLDLQRCRIQTFIMDDYFPKLKKLDLSNNYITDLSFLAGATALTELNLSNNRINEITPLTALNKLQKLWLDGNAVSDLSALEGFTDLAMLSAPGNYVEDLTPLSTCTRLSTLNIARNKVTDLSPMELLKEMRIFTANGNAFTSVAPLEKLTAMKEMNLSGNLVSDITKLSKMRNLTKLDIANCGVAQAEIDSLQKALSGCAINY